MIFFHELLTLTYCPSLKKSNFGKKNFFFEKTFYVGHKRCFTFEAKKVKVRSRIVTSSCLQWIALGLRNILGPVTFCALQDLWVKSCKN